VRWADFRSKVFTAPRIWGRVEIDSHSRTRDMNLAEEAEEYDALERLKIIPAQAAVISHQAFLEGNSIK
jgi:hypothetical protein